MFCVQASNTASGVKTPLVPSPLAARATLRRNSLLLRLIFLSCDWTDRKA
jgi:hypothetical protein